MLASYLSHYFNTEPFKQRVKNVAVGQTMPSLNTQILNRIKVIIPPLSEQRAIAIALSDIDNLITARENLIVKKSTIKKAAIQELLTGKRRLPGFSSVWETKRLADIADIDPENLGSETSADYSFKYISLENVDKGRLRGFTEQVFRTAPSRARRRVRQGDILISTVRPSLKSHLFIKDQVSDMVCSTGFSLVRCRPSYANPEYVFFQFFASYIERQIEALLTGSNYPAINSRDVKDLQIPFPPYAEQTAIAAILTDIDNEIESVHKQLNKTLHVKQGMMQELLTGKTRLA